MFRLPTRPLFLTATLALVGCGDDTPKFYTGVDVAEGRDAGGDATGGDATSADADSSDAATADVSADSGADTSAPDVSDVPDTSNISGGITVLEIRAPGQDSLEGGGLGAAFRTGAAPAVAPVATVGPCEIRSTDEESDLLEAGPSLDAGAITVAIAAETHTLTHDGTGYTSDADAGRQEFFAAGDMVSFTVAGGDDVPANSGTLTAPAAPVITAPDWTPLNGPDRSEPLTVAWEGTGGVALYINLLPVTVFPEPGVAEGNSITCAVPDTGSYTIPAEALEYLPEGGGFGPQTVALTVVRAESVTQPLSATGGSLVLNVTASETSIGAIE